MARIRALLFALGIAGCSGPTTLRVQVSEESPGVGATAVTVSVFDRHGLIARSRVSPAPLPGALLVRGLSAEPQALRVTAVGESDTRRQVGGVRVEVQPGGQRTATVVLSEARADADLDGVPDDLDECPTTPDPDQVSTVGQGRGDACGGSDQLPDLAGSDLATPEDAAAPPIVLHGVATASLVNDVVTIALPTGTTPGDLMIAAMTIGNINAAGQPTVAAPTGWTLVDRIDSGLTASLLVYLRLAGPAEPSSYTWAPSDLADSGVGWIAAYAGVDPASPIDARAQQVNTTSSTTCASPTLTTTVRNALLLAAFFGQSANGQANTWTAPPGLDPFASLNNAARRSGLGAATLRVNPGPAGPFTATASLAENICLTHVLALKPL